MATKTQTKSKPATTQPVKAIETREEKLSRLAQKRVTIALTKIRLIGNLAAYKPTTEQVNKIIETLATACQAIDARLRAAAPTEGQFTL